MINFFPHECIICISLFLLSSFYFAQNFLGCQDIRGDVLSSLKVFYQLSKLPRIFIVALAFHLTISHRYLSPSLTSFYPFLWGDHLSHGDESLLPELVTEGFNDDQIWEQLQLQVLVRVGVKLPKHKTILSDLYRTM